MLDRVLAQFDLRPLSINKVEDSHSSTVYKCKLSNGEINFIKISYSKLKYRREKEAYGILKGRVLIPKLVADWSGDRECPGAFLLSELKGKPLTTSASPTVAFQVGVLHASMHNVQPTSEIKMTGIKNEFPNWSTFIEDQFYNFSIDTKEVIEEELYKKASVKFEEMKQRLPSPNGPSFIHMDFRPANIIVEGDRVSGIIDFESVRFGSTESDFTKLYRDFLSFDSDLFNAYQQGYKSIRPLIDLELVLPFYLFTDTFNSIGWCKRRGLEANTLFFEKNLANLKKMLCN
ncbi:phosphotransferase family protein [Carnobacterium sp.]|uniref:phosphotransferase family protein n=1 Tax=Carnobacterium sp. TaxID=48221 RepID=UPI003C7281C6